MADANVNKIDPVNKIDEAKAEVLAEKAYAAAAADAPVAKKAAAPKKPAAKKIAAPAKKVAVKKTAKPAAKKVVKATPIKSKDTTIMAKTQHAAEDFTAKVKDAVADLQERAKTAMDKSNALFADAGEFTKGNVEALVESGKVLAAGLQDLGKVYVEDAKTGFETMTADVKELAAVKSPADFFKLQGEILRRNFDAPWRRVRSGRKPWSSWPMTLSHRFRAASAWRSKRSSRPPKGSRSLTARRSLSPPDREPNPPGRAAQCCPARLLCGAPFLFWRKPSLFGKRRPRRDLSCSTHSAIFVQWSSPCPLANMPSAPPRMKAMAIPAGRTRWAWPPKPAQNRRSQASSRS